MCNLYRMTKSPDEVAKWFSAMNELGGVNLTDEIHPGYPGLVVADDALQKMNWGFPLTLKSKKTGEPLKPKPVNNTRSDKLDTFMWRYSFEERRCLIPLTAWAEAEGPKGSKTRTWLSMPGDELFAAAGIWRNSDEFGLCYSMVMTDSAGDVASVHSRMPVLLAPEDFETWTGGSTGDAKALCRAWPGLVQIERTEQSWARQKASGDLLDRLV
ncbi:MAG: SOS response-associated peptidase family protein [Pseudomonadota bacterium]